MSNSNDSQLDEIEQIEALLREYIIRNLADPRTWPEYNAAQNDWRHILESRLGEAVADIKAQVADARAQQADALGLLKKDMQTAINDMRRGFEAELKHARGRYAVTTREPQQPRAIAEVSVAAESGQDHEEASFTGDNQEDDNLHTRNTSSSLASLDPSRMPPILKWGVLGVVALLVTLVAAFAMGVFDQRVAPPQTVEPQPVIQTPGPANASGMVRDTPEALRARGWSKLIGAGYMVDAADGGPRMVRERLCLAASPACDFSQIDVASPGFELDLAVQAVTQFTNEEMNCRTGPVALDSQIGSGLVDSLQQVLSCVSISQDVRCRERVSCATPADIVEGLPPGSWASWGGPVLNHLLEVLGADSIGGL